MHDRGGQRQRRVQLVGRAHDVGQVFHVKLDPKARFEVAVHDERRLGIEHGGAGQAAPDGLVNEVRLDAGLGRKHQRFGHAAGSYAEGLAVIEDFLTDPARYWRERGIPLDRVRLARENLIKAGVPIPAYIDDALAGA